MSYPPSGELQWNPRIPSGRKAPDTAPIPASYSVSVISSIVGRADTPKNRTNSHATPSESSMSPKKSSSRPRVSLRQKSSSVLVIPAGSFR